MEQYIPKSVVLAEINKRLHQLTDAAFDSMIGRNLTEIRDSLDTLEVKEVDLEKELGILDNAYFEFNGVMVKGTTIVEELKAIAKHFFELGFQARIDKELVEEIYSHIDSIKDTADRMTSGNFMHNRAAIKFSANTIAKVLELMGLKKMKGE